MEPHKLNFLKAGQWHKMCKLSSFSSPHSINSARLVYDWMTLKAQYPVRRPMLNFSLPLLITKSSDALLGNDWGIISLERRQPCPELQNRRCSRSKLFLMMSFPTEKGTFICWVAGSSRVSNLDSLSASSFSCIPWCPGTHIKMIEFDLPSFLRACIQSQTTEEIVVVPARAPIAALLSENRDVIISCFFRDLEINALQDDGDLGLKNRRPFAQKKAYSEV